MKAAGWTGESTFQNFLQRWTRESTFQKFLQQTHML